MQGRSAGWLAYGAAIAGNACYVLSVEDVAGSLRDSETFTDLKTGEKSTKTIMKLDVIVDRIVDVMIQREKMDATTVLWWVQKVWSSIYREVSRRNSAVTITVTSRWHQSI